jgi:biopolymer transport protein ExbB
MRYLLLGGLFIWPIVLESIIGLWVIIERFIYVLTVLPARLRSLAELVESVEGGNPKAGEPLGDFGKSVLKAFEERSLDVAILAIRADELVRDVERHLTALHMVAQTAPLFGLLGTVTGMIKVFMAIEAQTAAGQPVSPSDLAGGIWEALITTAAGLIVGIPALMAYIGFNRVVEHFAGEMDNAVTRIAHAAGRSGMEVM